MQMDYAKVVLANWPDFKKFITKFGENWAFRGQADTQWGLRNAIERTDFVHLNNRIEVDFLEEFERGARNYLSKDETPSHIIEWLALMQHHGAPTRLLDLTKSPFIAAYFAFEQCFIEEEHNIAIWGINIQFLKEKALNILSTEFDEAFHQSKNLINESIFEKIFYENNRSLVFPIEPFRMNRRYSLQQSVFVSTGIAQKPLMEQLHFLENDISRSVVKIELPSIEKRRALRDLLQMNLHRASLFPDLDGYAASLRLRYESMKTEKELQEENQKKFKDENYNFIP